MVKTTRPAMKVVVQMDKMEERINGFTTTQECESFSKNATDRGYPALAVKAQRRAVDLQVASHDIKDCMEKDVMAAGYAYEYLLSARKGKKARANSLWLSIKRVGFIEAVQRMVRSPESIGNYTALHEVGMEDLSFESVVVKHAHLFTVDIVRECTDRIAQPA